MCQRRDIDRLNPAARGSRGLNATNQPDRIGLSLLFQFRVGDVARGFAAQRTTGAGAHILIGCRSELCPCTGGSLRSAATRFPQGTGFDGRAAEGAALRLASGRNPGVGVPS
jgi:hypothetical protein